MSKRYGSIERKLYDEAESMNATAVIIFIIGAIMLVGGILAFISFTEYSFIMWTAIGSSLPFFGLGFGLCVRSNKIKEMAKVVGDQEKLLEELYDRVFGFEDITNHNENEVEESNQAVRVKNLSTRDLFPEENDETISGNVKNKEAVIDFAKLEKLEILSEYEKLYENNNISKEEYIEKKKEILNSND